MVQRGHSARSDEVLFMNILTDVLPTAITVTDTEYKIDSDFRTCLKIILAFEDNELTPQEKQVILLSMLFVKMPRDIGQALAQANVFLNGGKVSEEDTVAHPRLYSFSKDANFIFAAFKQTHNIDLQIENFHWWKFLALFMDLGTETTFCQLISLRKRINAGTATKEERAAAREMGDIFEVPEVDDRTLEEKEAEIQFMKLVEQGHKK